jgi:invasion protein IalB
VRTIRRGGLAACVAAGVAIAGSAQAPAQTDVRKRAPQPVQAAPQGQQPQAQNQQPEAQQQSGSEVAGKFGDWVLLCPKDKKAGGNCALFQSLADAKSKKRVFGQTLSYGPKGNLVLLVRSPAGVALQQGLTVGIEGGKTYRAPFQTCAGGVCQTLIVLTDEMLAEMRKAKQATLKVVALNGQAVQAASPLNGISAGLDALAALRKTP